MSSLQVRTRRNPAGLPACLYVSVFCCAVASARAQSAPAGDNAPTPAAPTTPAAAAPAPSTQPVVETSKPNPDLEAAKQAALESIRKRREEEAKAAAAANQPTKPAPAAGGELAAPPAPPVDTPALNPPVNVPVQKPIVEPLPTPSGPPVARMGGGAAASPPAAPPPAGKPGRPGKPGDAPPAAAANSGDRAKQLPSLEYMAKPIDPTSRVYSFDYDNTPWPDVLSDFARVSGLTLLGDVASVTGNMSFRSPKNFTYTEALHQLNELLLKRTLDKRLLERTDNYLEIWRLPDRIKQIPAEKMFDNFEQMTEANLDDYDMCIVNVDPPAGWSPFQIIESFRTLFDDYYGTQVVGNRIQLSGLVRDHHDFVKKINALAGEPEKSDPRPQLTYQCVFIKANDLQGLLRQIYPATPPGPPRPGVDAKAEQAKQITILSNPAANTVIMRAPQPVLTEMGMLCKQFDVGYNPTPPIIQRVQLKFANAQTLQGLIKPISMKEIQELTKPGSPYISPERLNSLTWDVLPDLQTNSLVVIGGAEGVAKAQALILQYDVADTLEDVKIVDLTNCDAAAMALNLSQIFPPQPKPGMPALRIKPDGDCRLVLVGSKTDLEKVAAMVAQLDTGDTDAPKEHFVKLQNAKPSQLAAQLTQIFGGAPGMPGVKVIKGKAVAGQPQAAAGPVRFMADDSTMTLIVVCDEREWAKVEPLIQRFDADAAAGKPELRSFALKNARARDVVAALTAMYPTLSGQPRPQAPGQMPQVNQTMERIWEDPRDGSIQVWAGKAFLEEITPLIEKLDVEGRDGLTVIKLECAQAAEVAPIILQGFGASGPGMAQPGVQPGRPPGIPPSAGGGSAVRVTAEPITNSLLVSAEPSEIDKITKLIADIDRKYCDEKKEARVIMICEHRPAAEVAETLMALAGAGRTGARPMPGRPGMPQAPSSSAGGTLKATPSGNKVVLDGPRDEVAKAVQIFPEVDAEVQRNQIVKWSVRDAEETEKALRIILGIGGAPTAASSAGGPAGGAAAALASLGKPSAGSQISLYANTYENTILISALPRDFPRIEEALKIWENDPTSVTGEAIDPGDGLPGIYVHLLKYKTAYDIAFTVEDLLKPKTGTGPTLDEGPDEKTLIVRNFKPSQKEAIVKMIEMFDLPDHEAGEDGVLPLDAKDIPAAVLARIAREVAEQSGLQVKWNTDLTGDKEFEIIDIHADDPAVPVRPVSTESPAAKPVSMRRPSLNPALRIAELSVEFALGQAATDTTQPSEPAKPQSIEIRPDPVNGRVNIYGPQELLDKLEKKLDKYRDLKPGTVYRRFPLKYAPVNDAAQKLEQIVNSLPTSAAQQARTRGGRNQPAAAPTMPAMPGQPQPGQPQQGQPQQGQPNQGRPGQPQQQMPIVQAGSQRIRVIPETRTKSLYVVCVSTDVPLIVDLLRSIDVEVIQNSQFKIFQLQRLDASTVANSLRDTLGITNQGFRRNIQMGGRGDQGNQGGQPGMQPGQQQPGGQPMAGMPGGAGATLSSDVETKITAEVQTNSIIVMGSEDQIRLVGSMIEEFEEKDNTQEQKTVRVKLVNARATELATIAKEMLARTGGGGGGGGGRFGGGGGGSRRGQVNVIADARTNSVIISGAAKDLVDAEKTIRELDKETTGSEIKQFTVQGDAASIANALKAIYPAGQSGDIVITADTSTGTLIVKAPGPQMTEISSQIEQLEKGTGDLKEIRTIKIGVADAEAVATTLNQIFGSPQGRTRGPGAVTIRGVKSAGIVYVQSSEEKFEEIKKVALSLDQNPGIQVQTFPLKFASAIDVEQKLNTMMAKAMATGGMKDVKLDLIGVVPDARTNALIVTGGPVTFSLIGDVLAAIDVESPTPIARETINYQLPGTANANEVANNINALFQGQSLQKTGIEPPSVTANAGANLVIVQANATQHKQIKEQIIDPIKLAMGSPLQDYQVQVKYARADEVKTTIETFMNQWRQTRGNKAQDAFMITADPNSNMLLVNCSPETKTVFDKQLAEIDKETAILAGERNPETYPVKWVNPTTVQQAIQSQFTRPSGARVADRDQVTVTPDMENKIVTVIANKDNHKKVKALIDMMDKENSNQAGEHLYKVQNAKAADLANTLTSQIRATRKATQGQYPVNVVADEASNTLIISASQTDFDALMVTIQSLDIAGSQRVTRAFQVKYVMPWTMANVINQQFQSRGSRSPNDQVTASFEDGTGAIIVSANSKNMEEVEKIILDSDKPNTGSIKETRFIKLANARAEDVAKTINDAFRAKTVANRQGVFPVAASADMASNNVIVTATSEYFDEITAMAANLDKAGGRTVYTVQFPDQVPAKSASENINRMYGAAGGREGVKAEFHEPTNTLMVLATEGEYTKIKAEYIDKVKEMPATGAMKVYKIALKHVVADEVAKTLQEFFDKKAGKGQANLPPWMRGGGGEASRQDNNVSFTAEPGSNMLLVNCTEATKELIDDILKDIDTDVIEGGRTVEIVPLQYMDAAELVTLLTEYLKVSKRTPSENKQQLPWWMSDMVDVNKPEQTVLAGDMRLKAIESSNSIMVAGKPERVLEVKAKIAEFDKPQEGRSDVPREIKLVNARAGELADLFTKLFIEGAAGGKSTGGYKPVITANEGSNSLWVKAKTAEFNNIKAMADGIDASMKDEPTGIKMIQLSPGRDAEELARKVEKQINDSEQDKATRIKDYKPNRVRINADLMSNALMVSASKSQLEEVQRVIETLSNMAPTSGRVRTFIPTQNLTPEQAKELIDKLQDSNKTRTTGGRSDATWTRHRRTDRVIRSRTATTLPLILAQVAMTTAVAQTPPAGKDDAAPRGPTVVQVRPREQPGLTPPAATTRPTGAPALQVPPTATMTDDAVRNFQRRLSGSPITVTATSGGIIVDGPQDDVDVINSVLQLVDRTQPSKKIEYVQLEFAQAKNLAQTLTEALGKISRPNKPDDKVDIIADTRTNGLYIAAIPERMEEVRNLIKQNEDFAARDPGKQIRKFDLKNRRATEAGETLKKLVTGYLRQKGLDASQISIEVDPLTNSIYITASAGDLRVLEPLISGIDAEPPEETPEKAALNPTSADIMVVPLRIAKADSVGKLLNDMLQKAASGDTPMKDFLRRLRVLDENGNPIATVDLNRPTVVVGDPDSNSLIIASSRENALILKQVALAFDKDPARAEVKHAIIPLKYADAGELAEQINKMLTDGENLTMSPGKTEKSGRPDGDAGALVYKAVVSADARTNQIVLVGRPDAVDLLTGVVNTMDVRGQDVMPFSIIKLEYASAGALEEALTSMFKERQDNMPLGKSENAKKAETVIVRADTKSKSLIVAAKTGRLEEVKALIKQLDVPSTALIEDIRTITLKNGNAVEMAEKLKTLWEERQKAQDSGSKGPKLEIPAIVADTRSNSLIVAASKGDYEAIASVVAKIEALELNPAAGIYIVRLNNNSAKALQPALKALFEQRAKMRTVDGKIRPEDEIALEVDELTNALILSGSKENYDVLMSKLTELDSALVNEGQVEFFVVDHVDAKRIKDAIDQLFEGDGPFKTGAASDSDIAKKRAKVTVTLDDRANMLIVSASPENMRLVREIYTRMNGVGGAWPGGDTRMVVVENGDAVKIASQIIEHFKQVDELRGSTGENKSPFGITAFADARSNRIVLGGTKDGIDRAAALVSQLDVPPGDPSATVQVYKLTQTRASKVGETIQAIFDERKKPRGDADKVPDLGVKIEWNDSTNSMVINATREDHILIRDLVSQLDVPTDILKNVRIFPLQKARAEQVKEILDKTYGGADGGTGGGTAGGSGASGGSLVTVNADTRVNSLVVSAPPGELENIAKIIEMLDSAMPIDTAQVGIFVCENEDAEKMAELINQIISGQGTAGGSSSGGGSGGAGTTGATATAASNQAGASLISYQGTGPDGRELFLKTIRENVLVTHSERTNSVIVTAPPAALQLIEALVRKLDRIQKRSVLVKVFKLINSDATKMVELLEQMFAQDEGSESEAEFQRGREIEVEGASGAGSSGVPTASSQGNVSKGTFGRPKTTFTADQRTNSILTAGWPEDIDVVANVISQLDNQQVPDRERIVYSVVNGTAADLQATLQDYFDQDAQRIDRLGDSVSAQARMDQEVQVVAYEESNQLVLSTSPRYRRQVLDLIEQLDQAPPQVMIQVMIAEVTLDDRFEMGMEFALQQLRFSETATPGGNGILQSTHFDAIGGTDLGAAGSGLGGVSFTLTGEDFNFLVRALQSDSRLEVIQRPSVMCQNNQTANISVGQDVPTVTGSTIGIGGQATSQVQYQKVGIILDVEPHINPDGFVYMNVRPEVSSISDSSVNIGNGAVLPIFNSRSAETTVAVKDGETVIIGGLITTIDNESESKVPVLGDLPGIGAAFRSTVRTKNRTELLIALTPQIVRTVEDARRTSIAHRDESGIITDKMKQSILFGKLKIEPETSSLIDDINQPPMMDQPLTLPEDPDRTLPPVPGRFVEPPTFSDPAYTQPIGDSLIPITPVRTQPQITPLPSSPAPSGAPRPKYGPSSPRYGPMSPTEVETLGRRRGDSALGMAAPRD